VSRSFSTINFYILCNILLTGRKEEGRRKKEEGEEGEEGEERKRGKK